MEITKDNFTSDKAQSLRTENILISYINEYIIINLLTLSYFHNLLILIDNMFILRHLKGVFIANWLLELPPL